MKKILLSLFLLSFGNLSFSAARLNRSVVEHSVQQSPLNSVSAITPSVEAIKKIQKNKPKTKRSPKKYIGLELLYDASKNDVESIRDLKNKYLLEKIINIRDERGLSPLMLASKFGQRDAVFSLLSILRIDVDAQDSEGNTALMYACHGGHTDIVKMLLIKGLDINKKNNSGQTALIFAAMNNNIDSIELLRIFNANPNIQDSNGNSALIYACNNRNLVTVHYLLTFPNINIFNPNLMGFNAKDYALGSPEITNLLLSKALITIKTGLITSLIEQLKK